MGQEFLHRLRRCRPVHTGLAERLAVRYRARSQGVPRGWVIECESREDGPDGRRTPVCGQFLQCRGGGTKVFFSLLLLVGIRGGRIRFASARTCVLRETTCTGL